MTEPRLPFASTAPPDERTIGTVLGPELVTRLHGLLQSVRLYNESNNVVQTQLRQFMESLATFGEDEITMLSTGEHFYLNGIRLKPRPHHSRHFEGVLVELETRCLGGLRFLEGLSLRELGAFLRLFTAAADAPQSEKLPRAAMEAGIIHIVPVPAREVNLEEGIGETHDGKGLLDERVRARETYWNAVNGSRVILESVARTRKPSIGKAKRLVQPLIDTIMKNEYSILGLAALKNHDEYTYAHCVNVSMLSIAIGHRLELPRSVLAGLGVAGLLHDLGKLSVSPGILQKPGKLSFEEWSEIEMHPLEGVRLMCNYTGFERGTVDIMRVILMHHLTYDGMGYPKITPPRRQSTLARVVAAADCYDAMTGHRSYQNRPLTGVETLGSLLTTEASRFDPVVRRALIQCVGLYPAGTIMLTADRHMVLSVVPNVSDAQRPFCRVLAEPDGRTMALDETVIWDPMPASQSVVRVLTPEDVDIDVEAYLLS